MTTNPAGGGRLTTHVLDTAAGTPATGVAIALFRLSGDGGRTLLREATDEPRRPLRRPASCGSEFVAGTYELVFRCRRALRARRRGAARARRSSPRSRSASGFRTRQAHYHVPLLISPYGYSTYRGS
jgi:5-hydroxyisourate hydrolase